MRFSKYEFNIKLLSGIILFIYIYIKFSFVGGAHEMFDGSSKDMVGVLRASKLIFKNLFLFKILDRFYIQVIIRVTLQNYAAQ